jgi:hypothetical protein
MTPNRVDAPWIFDALRESSIGKSLVLIIHHCDTAFGCLYGIMFPSASSNPIGYAVLVQGSRFKVQSSMWCFYCFVPLQPPKSQITEP